MSFRLASSLLLAAVTASACLQAHHTLFIDDASAERLADGHLVTTVKVACNGDCSARGAYCVRVTWPAQGTFLGDTHETCSDEVPAPGPTTIVVRSNGPIPAPGPDGPGMATVDLVEPDGAPIIGDDVGFLGGAGSPSTWHLPQP
jgi:hypothetical protein